jgi:hypothetical protein
MPWGADAKAMDATRHSSHARLRALCLALLTPLLCAWRPYESVDGPVTPTGQLAIEWGALHLQIRQPQLSLAAPQLLARLGVTPKLEIGVRGHYRLTLRDSAMPWDSGLGAGSFGAYGKWELISGSATQSNWSRPAISILGGVDFLTAQAVWGLEARLAGTLWIGPVMTHLNIGFEHRGGPGVLVGAVVGVPLSFGLTPAVEASGLVRFNPNPSQASVLFSLTQTLGKLPFVLDVGLRRGLTAGVPEWTVLGGVTMRLTLWRPAL